MSCKRRLLRFLFWSAAFLMCSAEALHATTYYWRGVGTSWKLASNWSTTSGGGGDGAVPGNADIAIFDSNGNGNCDIDDNVDATTFTISSGYTATITQTSTYTIILDSYSQADGVFTGGSGTIDINGGFILSGGTFTSTSGNLEILAGVTFSAGTFNHNNGTLVFTNNAGVKTVDVPTEWTLYNFTLNDADGTRHDVNSADTIVVENNMTITDGRMQTGYIRVEGDVTFDATADDIFLTTIIFGGGNNQDFQINCTSTYVDGKITVRKSAGTVTLQDDLGQDRSEGDFELIKGTFDPNDNAFARDTYTQSDGTFDVGTGNVDINNAMTLSGGTFNASSGNTYVAGAVTFSGGTFTHNSGTFTFDGSGNYTCNLFTETNFNNLVFHNTGTRHDFNSADTMDVAGTLTIKDSYIRYGYIRVDGDVTFEAAADDLFLTRIIFTGGADQNFTISTTSTYVDGGLVVRKSAGTVTQIGDLGQDRSEADFILEGGTYDPNDNAFACDNFNQSGGTFAAGSGTIDINNAMTISGGTFNASSGNTYALGAVTFSGGGFTHNSGTFTFDGGGNYTCNLYTETYFNNLVLHNTGVRHDFNAADTMDVAGTLTVNDRYYRFGYIRVNGNVTFNSNIDAGSTFGLIFEGGAAQSFDPSTSYANWTGHLIVRKTAGTVTLQQPISIGTYDITCQKGSLDFNDKAVTCGDITIDKGHIDCSSSTVDMSGALTINGGTFDATTGTHTLGGSYARTGGNFNHNSGTFTIDPPADVTYNTMTEDTFNTFNFSPASFNINFDIDAADTLYVLGTFTATNGLSGTTGTLKAAGDVSTNSGMRQFNGDLIFVGGANQDFDNNDDPSNFWGDVYVRKSGGTLTLQAAWTGYAGKTFYMHGGDVDCNTQTFSPHHFSQEEDHFDGSSGTVDMGGNFTLNDGTYDATSGTTTLGGSFARTGGNFNHNSGTWTVDGPDGMTYNTLTEDTFNVFNFSKDAANNNFDINSADTLYVLGNLTVDGGWDAGSGYIKVAGNVTTTSGCRDVTSDLIFVGTGTQTFDLTGATDNFDGYIHIRKSSGSVTLLSDLTMTAGKEFRLWDADFAMSTFSATLGTYQQDDGTFTCGSGTVTVLGNMVMDGGDFTHADNSTAETNNIDLTVGGALTLNTGSTIDVDGEGFDAGEGTGAPTNGYDGGAHGGAGGVNGTGPTGITTYGSYTAPTNLGSGGDNTFATGDAGAGGGAIDITVSGALTINSTADITANGVNSGVASGAGGSVYITAQTISGDGNITANGADASAHAGGGGGRVAIILTGGGADFSGYTGTVSAYGGDAPTVGEEGAAGTVYLEETADAAGAGQLIIDNNGHAADPSQGITTKIPSGQTWNIYDLVIQNKAILEIGSGETFDLKTNNITSDADDNSDGIHWYNGSTLTLTAGTMTFQDMTLTTDGTVSTTGNMIVNTGGVITHFNNSDAETYAIDLTLTGDMTLNTGSSIDADGLGFDAGEGTGTPSSGYDGAGHGGVGGADASVPTGNTTYGSFTAPVNLGSGGSNTFGAGDGGAGGGEIKLTISGALTINSTADITCDGQASGVAAGSGGSVYITTGTISGDGNISADGAYSDNSDGGGGGGRVAVILTGGGADFSSYTGTASAYGGGSAHANPYDGAAGTVYLEETADAAGAGKLIIDNNNLSCYTEDDVTTKIPSGQTWNISELVIQNKAILELGSGETIDLKVNNITSDGDDNSCGIHWYNGGTLTLTAGTMTFQDMTLKCNGAVSTTGNMIVNTGGVITHFNNSTAETYTLDLTLTGDMTLNTGSTIDVDGLGLDAGNGTGTPSSGYDGAGHGGVGGADASVPTGNTTYGSLTAPTNLGSGGSNTFGAGDGGAGGGAVDLTVSGALTINSTADITANGQASGVAAGSGGSVYITTGTFSGDGNISADGAYSDNSDGGGGGGRVAVILTSGGADFSSYTGTASAYGGGSAHANPYDGAAGTVYLEETADAAGAGKIIIDNNNLSCYTEDDVTTKIPSGQTWNISELVIQNKGVLELGSGETIDLKVNNITSDGDDNSCGIHWYNGGTLTLTAGTMTFQDMTLTCDGAVSTTGNMIVNTGGVITHFNNSTAETYSLDLDITGDLTLNTGSTIDADGLGFDAGNGTGKPSSGYHGAGHGGVGGVNGSSPTGTTTYGAVTAPVNLGSGGSNTFGAGDGGAGGGEIKLTVSGATTINSTADITAKGAASGVASGSGGSVYITTGTIAGDGTISANGADGLTSYPGGGGGRVAVILTGGGADFSGYTGTTSAYGGVAASDDEDGSAGTVYLQETADGANGGELIIDNNDLDAATDDLVLTEIAQDESVGELTMRNNGVLELAGNTLTITKSATTSISIEDANNWILSEATDESNIVKWEIGTGTGAYVFPFAAVDGTAIPFTFNVATAGTESGTGSVSLLTYPTADNNTPLPSGVTDMKGTDDGADNSDHAIDRFWRITTAGFSSNPSASLVFTYDEDDITGNAAGFTEDDLKPQRWDATEGSWVYPHVWGTLNTTNNTFTTENQSTFSPWVLSDETDPLPVSLIDFRCQLTEHQDVQIDWSTASEINNDYFTIERSPDAQNFEAIEEIPGAGNSNEVLHYSTIDEQPTTNNGQLLYYRLKQTDFDGAFEYSKIVPVSLKNIIGELDIFPNPSAQGENMYINVDNALIGKEVLIVVTDINGRQTYSKVFYTTQNQVIPIETDHNLAAGIYTITASSDNRLFKRRLIIR